MRRSTTTALGAVFAALALSGCASHAAPAGSAAPAHRGGGTPSASAPLSSAQLNQRLLNESDLGEGYIRKPEPARRDDDVTVIGCPALEKLGANAATGSGLDFTRKTKASFTYTGSSSSEIGEELYSDSPAKLSNGISKDFDAMLSCPTYQVASGSSAIDVETAKAAAPDLGDEQWSQVLTFSVGGQLSIVKQMAVRTDNVLVIVSGSPRLVDAHLAKAVSKGLRTR